MEIENNDYEDENGNYGRVGISIFDKAVPSPEANCEDLLKGVTVTLCHRGEGVLAPCRDRKTRPSGKQPTFMSQVMPPPP